MLKRSSIFYLSRFGIFSAVLYCIPVIFFLKDKKFSDTWLLFLGNALFLFSIFIFGAIYSRKKNNKASKVFNGFAVTFAGVIFSCILILLLTLVFAPNVYHIGSSNEVLQQTPAAITKKNEHGLLFIMLANALIGNFFAGTFATTIAKSSAEKEKLPS
jgi:hypothetical protein